MKKPVLRDEWIYHAKEIGYDFAIAFNHDNLEQPYDYIGNWETAQTMANEGYIVVVIPSVYEVSGRPTWKWQNMIDHEYAAAIDCFGEGYLK